MTKTENKYPQCKTCSLTPAQQATITDLRAKGAPYTEVSTYIGTNFAETISPDAVSNHLRKHVTTLQPLLGVVNPKAPKGWEARVELDGDTGQVTTTPQTNDKITDFTSILEEFGIDPEEYEISGPVRISKWQSFSGEWLTSYKFEIARITGKEEIDLPTLFQEVRSNIIYKAPSVKPVSSTRSLVTVFADLQAGKVGSRGGSIELIDRAQEKQEKLSAYADQHACAEAVFLDAGDIVESFENTAQQGFTNDLSIMQQLDLAGTIEQEFITLLSRKHETVRVAGVPSNHGAWRKGKDVLGRPSDDWGLFLLKQIQKAYKLNEDVYGNVSFNYPDEWRKSLNLNVQGTGLGLVHGEDSSLAQMSNWWAKQVHGASPIAESDILVHGHYHTFGVNPSGRSMKTGLQKWIISSTTMDNGSDWWANKDGSDSDAGMTVFVVDNEKGLDLQSLTVL